MQAYLLQESDQKILSQISSFFSDDEQDCVILFLLLTSYCFLDVTKIIDLNKWEILHQMEWVSYYLYCMSHKKKKKKKYAWSVDWFKRFSYTKLLPR